MKYNRFLPLLIPVLTFCFSEIYFFYPRMIYNILVAVFLLFLFTVRQFTLASNRKEDWWNYIILPSFFYTGLIIFTTMIPSSLVIQVLFIINLIFLYYYFLIIYYFLINTKEYQDNSLENISSYGNFLSYYFIASSAYGLQAFLNISTWVLVFSLMIANLLITYQVIWANKINIKKGLFYILLICLVLVELAWSVSFLTLSYYVLGLILAVCYYILIGLVRFYLLNSLTKKLIKMYLIFGFSSILVVLFTARWK